MKVIFLFVWFTSFSLGVFSQEKEIESLVITIPLEGNRSFSLNDLVVEIPVCKYDKEFAFSFTGDDALLGIYSRAFNYVHGNYVDDDPVFHEEVEPRTTGLVPSRILTYSDGCGNEIPFRLATNWMSSKVGQNIHKDGNQWLPYMWWSECERFTDFYNGILNHAGDMENLPDSSIRKTMLGVADTLGIYPFVLGVPGGTRGFPEAGVASPDVYFMEAGSFGDGSTSLAALTNETLWKGRFPRTVLDGITEFQVLKEKLESRRKEGSWINFFCHEIKNGTSPVNGQFNTQVCWALLDYLYEEYGSGGKDNVWFASSPEIHEYSYTRLNTFIAASVEGGNLLIRLQAGVLPHFYFKELTLKLSGLGEVELENLAFSSSITSASYTSSEGKGLVNLCFSDFGLSRAEKYTALLERKQTRSALKEARFFADRLLPALRAPFESRISQVTISDEYPDGIGCVANGTPGSALPYSENGALIVTGTLNEPLPVYDIAGRCVYRIPVTEASEHRVPLARGFYVVNGTLVSVQ